ncbi:MAG: hypothetical protein QNJ53_12650 [Pleurocapsa sp. MO_192.B19]|nr:hypothetical protein [Pleurocapsa sp. MO_192.B19]
MIAPSSCFARLATHSRCVAVRFFIKALKATHTQKPRVINIDKNPSYPPAIEQLKKSSILPEDTKLRQIKSLELHRARFWLRLEKVLLHHHFLLVVRISWKTGKRLEKEDYSHLKGRKKLGSKDEKAVKLVKPPCT